MLAQNHIVAYIESSAPEYARLIDIARRANRLCRYGFMSSAGHAAACYSLVSSTYAEMLRNGSASRDDLYSAADLLKAAVLLAEWREPDAELSA